MESTTALQPTPPDRIRKPLTIVGTIVLSLVPCLWPPRLVSGDLPSHVYNAWLTQLLEQGRITGLHLTHPFGNILVDLILVRMLPWLGPTGAARTLGILVASTFFWGGMFLSWKIAARNV